MTLEREEILRLLRESKEPLLTAEIARRRGSTMEAVYQLLRQLHLEGKVEKLRLHGEHIISWKAA